MTVTFELSVWQQYSKYDDQEHTTTKVLTTSRTYLNNMIKKLQQKAWREVVVDDRNMMYYIDKSLHDCSEVHIEILDLV